MGKLNELLKITNGIISLESCDCKLNSVLGSKQLHVTCWKRKSANYLQMISL